MITVSKIILIGALNSAGIQPANQQADFQDSFTNEESAQIIQSLSSEEEMHNINKLELSMNHLTELERAQQLQVAIEHYGKKLKLANAPWAK